MEKILSYPRENTSPSLGDRWLLKQQQQQLCSHWKFFQRIETGNVLTFISHA